jgi:uncharacterized protein DUF3617
MRYFVALVLTCLAMTAMAGDPPVFRKGLWEFNRTVDAGGGQPLTMKMQECIDPTEDMKKQNLSAAQIGCKSSSSRNGDKYNVTADCVIQGVAMESKSVITVESDSAYRIDVETLAGGKTTKELLVARRVGDC